MAFGKLLPDIVTGHRYVGDILLVIDPVTNTFFVQHPSPTSINSQPKLYLDQKHSSGRRAYEDWVRRKKLEEAEKRRWGSIEEIDYSYDRRPFC